jgi:hypothetical protein
MQCNIDESGARVRRVYGIMTLFVSIILIGLALWSHIWWLWLIAAATTGTGLFCLFEAQKKWCALRAMGIKTSI